MNPEKNGRTPCVQTVIGPVSALGHAQCHEHIYLRKGPSYACNHALCMDDYDKSLQELQEYYAHGGRTIVDAQPGFFGRDAEILRRLSVQSGVQIVAVTGFHKLQFMEEGSPLPKLSREELTALFVSEIRDGMLQPDGTRSAAKAGMVKLAYEKEGWRSEEYKTLFEAAADAAAQTGAPVMVHTEKQNDLLGLLAFLAQHHVPAERVLICHLDRTNTDPEYHKTLLRTGCYFCYDSVHRYKYVSDEQELALLKEVCEAGYAGQIVLSLDTTNQRLRAYNAPDMGLDYILTDFIPMLRAAGFTESQISAMCESNAVEILQLQDTEVTR